MNTTFARALIALSLIATLTECADRNDTGANGAAHGNRQPAVPTAVVRYERVPLLAKGYGSVAGGANASASLAFPESGRIARVYVSVGQHVVAGESLAQLDGAPFETQLESAKAAYARVLAGARPQQLEQTDAQIAAARTQLAVATAQLDRQEKLLLLGISAQSDVDSAKAAVSSAQSQLRVLQEQQSSQTHPWAPDVRQAKAAVDAAELAVEQATLSAPFSGVVTQRLHNDGESVDFTMPVIQIAKDSNVVFTAAFPPAEAVRLHDGDPAVVTTHDSGATAHGVVIAINPQQSDAKQVDVLIRLNSGGVAFGPGAYGTAQVRIGSQRALVVPKEAIVSDPTTGTVHVFKKVGTQFVPTTVTLHQTIGNLAVVTSDALDSDDRVAAQGAFELSNPSGAGQSAPDSD